MRVLEKERIYQLKWRVNEPSEGIFYIRYNFPVLAEDIRFRVLSLNPLKIRRTIYHYDEKEAEDEFIFGNNSLIVRELL